MSKIVAVTRADVARAQLVIGLNDSLGRATAPGIRKVAGPADENGNGHADGR